MCGWQPHAERKGSRSCFILDVSHLLYIIHVGSLSRDRKGILGRRHRAQDIYGVMVHFLFSVDQYFFGYSLGTVVDVILCLSKLLCFSALFGTKYVLYCKECRHCKWPVIVLTKVINNKKYPANFEKKNVLKLMIILRWMSNEFYGKKEL